MLSRIADWANYRRLLSLASSPLAGLTESYLWWNLECDYYDLEKLSGPIAELMVYQGSFQSYDQYACPLLSKDDNCINVG